MSNSNYTYLLSRIKQIEGEVARLRAIETRPALVGCKVVRSADQSVPSGVWTAINWDTEISSVGGDCWEPGYPSRLVAPRDGYYVITAQATILDVSDTGGIRQIAIRDSSGTIVNVPLSRGYDPVFGLTVVWAHLGFCWLAEGDWLEVVCYQNSGANKTLRGTTNGGASANHCAFWSIY